MRFKILPLRKMDLCSIRKNINCPSHGNCCVHRTIVVFFFFFFLQNDYQFTNWALLELEPILLSSDFQIFKSFAADLMMIFMIHEVSKQKQIKQSSESYFVPRYKNSASFVSTKSYVVVDL